MRHSELSPINFFRCEKKCLQKISFPVKKRAVLHFLSFATKDEQDTFLCSLIQVKGVKRRRIRDLPSRKKIDPKPRNASFGYHISNGTSMFPVCQKGFKLLYGLATIQVSFIIIEFKLLLNNHTSKFYDNTHFYRLND